MLLNIDNGTFLHLQEIEKHRFLIRSTNFKIIVYIFKQQVIHVVEKIKSKL